MKRFMHAVFHGRNAGMKWQVGDNAKVVDPIPGDKYPECFPVGLEFIVNDLVYFKGVEYVLYGGPFNAAICAKRCINLSTKKIA